MMRFLVANVYRNHISPRKAFIALNPEEVRQSLWTVYDRCQMAEMYGWSFHEWLEQMTGRGYGYSCVRVIRFEGPGVNGKNLKLPDIQELITLEEKDDPDDPR